MASNDSDSDRRVRSILASRPLCVQMAQAAQSATERAAEEGDPHRTLHLSYHHCRISGAGDSIRRQMLTPASMLDHVTRHRSEPRILLFCSLPSTLFSSSLVRLCSLQPRRRIVRCSSRHPRVSLRLLAQHASIVSVHRGAAPVALLPPADLCCAIRIRRGLLVGCGVARSCADSERRSAHRQRKWRRCSHRRRTA